MCRERARTARVARTTGDHEMKTSPQPFCHSPGDLEAPPPSLFAPVSVIHGSYHGPIVYIGPWFVQTWVSYTVFKTATDLFVCFVFQDSLQNRQAQFIEWAHFIRRLLSKLVFYAQSTRTVVSGRRRRLESAYFIRRLE